MQKSFRRRLLLAGASIVTAGFVLLRFIPLGNVAQTSPHHTDKKLRTRHYAAAPEEIRQYLQKAVPSLRTYGRPWKIVGSFTQHATQHAGIEIVCEIPVLFFTDDLVITIRDKKQSSVIDIKSSSRVGKSDFGKNRQHILQILYILDLNYI